MIIVTGGAGMIGSNIINYLNKSSYTNIICVDDLTDGQKFRNLSDLIISDYIDKDSFIEDVQRRRLPKPTAIFHQGACSSTTEWNGKFMMEQNYEYSKILCSWAETQKVPFIYASSAAVYGAGSSFTEALENERPLNVYGYSKKLFDDYVRKNIPRRSAPIVGLRYFNVYGPRENHKGSMSSVAYHLYIQHKRGEKLKLFGANDGIGAGMQRRDFIHVDDVASVNLWALESEVSGVINCGTGSAEPFLSVASAIVDACGQRDLEFIDFPDQLKGKYQNFTQADITQLRSLGYKKSFMTVAEGVKRYVSYLDGDSRC